MEVKGTIFKINEVEKFQSGFEKQTIVLNTGGQYPQFLPIEFVNKSIAHLDSIKIGDRVEVSINLQGREWTNNRQETKYIVSLTGWRINRQQAVQSQSQSTVHQTQNVQRDSFIPNNNGEDLPF